MRNDAALGKFSTGKHTYSYDMLMPLDAIAFGTRVFKLCGGGVAALIAAKSQNAELTPADLLNTISTALSGVDEDKLSALLTESIQRCYTPDNQPFSDMVVFQKWFQQYPEELYPMGFLAVYNLVKDFFPLSLVTMPGNSRPSGEKTA